jgi:energy-converting hydrogenase Eha subunit H
MRKIFVLLALLALSLPVAGMAGLSAGDGTLSVEDGRGKVSIQARGAIIGRVDRGTVTIYDLTPEDASDPYVFGQYQPPSLVGETGIKYTGTGLRFRVIGGRYRIVIQGRGIDLSVVGKGFGTIVRGDDVLPGVYSLDGDDCRKERAACTPLPDVEKRFQLGVNAERG